MMNQRGEQTSTLSLRWGLVASLIFGSVGWVVGMTIPGPVHGTSFVATVLFSASMGTISFFPGSTVGKVIAEVRGRYA